jgi:predicted nuclease of predicted toxin-antitoxin system
MRFLADMGISLRTVEWLREKGYNVVHLSEEGLQKLPDPEVLEKTRLENRILLTIDLDFTQLLAISRSLLPSVVLFRLGNENYNQINDCLDVLLEEYVDDLQSGVMISVSSKSFRVRKLPIE